MEKEYAEYLFRRTKEDYNLIAEDFSRTRAFVPKDLRVLGQYTFGGDRVLDLGCGNGWLLEIFREKSIDYVGVDVSEKLIKIAKEKYAPIPAPPLVRAGENSIFRPVVRFLIADALNLPLPDNYFDKIYCLAAFHHIPSAELRLRFLKEARRVLKPEGLLILTVWNLWYLWLHPLILVKEKRLRYYFSLIFKYTLLKILGKSKLDFKDIFISWRDITQRYIHCFTPGELKQLVEKADFKIKEIGISKRAETKETNIYLIAEK